jgi:hypothetical protein
MKRVAEAHPFTAGFIVFLGVFFIGSILGISTGLVIFFFSKPQPAPNDGGSMAAAAIWSISVTASLILGIVIGLLTAMFFKLTAKKP